MQPIRTVFSRILEDRLLLALFIAIVPLAWVTETPARDWINLIDQHTMIALTGFMLLSRGVEESGYLQRFAEKLQEKKYSERQLALILVAFAALLSAVITNDVALFILVPLVISMARSLQLPLLKLVIFLALAVNVGSSLTPIGNPQNLYLWSVSGLSVLAFCWMMLPLVLPLLVMLLVAATLSFRSQMIPSMSLSTSNIKHSRLFYGSLLGYPCFIVLLELSWGGVAAVAIFVVYLVKQRSVLRGVDWLLLALFASMFIVFGLLAKIPLLNLFMTSTGITEPANEFRILLAATLVSQGMSNVPATLFLVPFYAEIEEVLKPLAWGVTVGGFGIVIGSMANLIALRLVRPALSLQEQQRAVRYFHQWSIPAILIGAALAIGILFLM